MKSLFSASLRLCAKAGMATVGVVAVDGTKIGAPASLQANRTNEVIDAEVEAMFAEAAAADAADDAVFGSARGDEPPAQLRGRADRRRRFARAKELLDEELAAERQAHERHLAERAAKEAERGKKLRGRKPKAPEDKAGYKPSKVNTSDPESKVMSTANGFVQGYNAQAVANQDQVIVAAEVTDEHNDVHQLHPMIDATDASLAAAGIDERPATLLADAGYASEENFAALDDDDPDCYVATRNMRNNPQPAQRAARAAALRRVARRQDGPQGLTQGRAGGLPPPPSNHRTGLRSDQGRPRDQTVHAKRQSRGRLRMEADRRHPQPVEALPTRPHRRHDRPLQPDRSRDHRLTEHQWRTATTPCGPPAPDPRWPSSCRTLRSRRPHRFPQQAPRSWRFWKRST